MPDQLIPMDTTTLLPPSNVLAALDLFIAKRTTVVDADYTVLVTDRLVVYTTLTVARAVTLPSAAGAVPGRAYVIKDESGSCNGTRTITISPASGTIDGAANVVLNTAYAKTTLYTNGTNWFTR